MGLMSRALEVLNLKSKPRSFDEVIASLDGRGRARTKTAALVNDTLALQVTTVLACVDAIASGCGTPPLNVYTLENERKKEARDDPSWRLLHRRPNEWQTSLEWRETMSRHAALTYGGLSIKVFTNGVLRELIPVAPKNWTLEYNARYERRFRVLDEFGEIGVFTDDEVFYLPNRQWDAIHSLSAVKLAREAIGLAIAAEDSQALLHENGGQPGGILSTDQQLTSDVIKRVKEAWDKNSSGNNRFKTALLDGGLKYQSMMMTGVDAQHVETRKMQVEEICRAFGVFPMIVMQSDKTSTFASAESFFQAHNQLTLARWHELWRQRLDEFCLDGAGPLFVDFDTRALRGVTLRDQGEYYAKASGAGGAAAWLTQNDIRDDLGLPPINGGDVLYPPSALLKAQGGTNDPASNSE